MEKIVETALGRVYFGRNDTTEYRSTVANDALRRLVAAAVAREAGVNIDDDAVSWRVRFDRRDIAGTAGSETVAEVEITVDHSRQAAPLPE